MELNIDELKKLLTSLDFSKSGEIENLNTNELKIYCMERINEISEQINSEITLLNKNEITNIEELYRNLNYASSNNKLPILLPTLNLLTIIKNELKKL